MPSPSGPLLAAYDAVDALQHRVEFHREQYADAEVALEQLKVYTVSCEGRIKELGRAGGKGLGRAGLPTPGAVHRSPEPVPSYQRLGAHHVKYEGAHGRTL